MTYTFYNSDGPAALLEDDLINYINNEYLFNCDDIERNRIYKEIKSAEDDDNEETDEIINRIYRKFMKEKISESALKRVIKACLLENAETFEPDNEEEDSDKYSEEENGADCRTYGAEEEDSDNSEEEDNEEDNAEAEEDN